MTDDTPDPWERQKGETEQAYYAFCLYRDQTIPRGYAAVISELGKSKTLIHRWGSRWYWRERTRAYDRHLEDQVRREQVAATKAMARRQARDAQAYQAVMIAPVEILLKRMADPTRRAEIEALSTGDLIQLSVLTGRLFPRMALSERMARGAPVQDLSQFLDDDTGEISAPTSPRETYDWMRDALGALEQATGGRLELPAAGETT